MKTHRFFHRFVGITLAMVAAAVVAVVCNLAIFTLLFPTIVELAPLPSWAETSGLAVGLCLVVIGLAHLGLLGTLGWQIRLLQRVSPAHALLAALGMVSLLLLVSNVPLLSDIGNQYEAHLETGGEWSLLFVNHGLHIVFLIIGAWCAAFKRRVLARGAYPEKAERDEAVFLSTHYIGVFSGLLGLLVLALLVITRFPSRFLPHSVVVFGAIALVPYVVSMISWIFLKRHQSLREWCDEKQFLDVARAALATLFAVIPLLAVGYFAQRSWIPEYMVGDLWFPTVAFLVLLVFSLSTLWFTRRPG